MVCYIPIKRLYTLQKTKHRKKKKKKEKQSMYVNPQVKTNKDGASDMLQ
jgi:hypothetical protein